MKLIGFMLNVNLNGKVKSMYNCNGATVEEAIASGLKIFKENKKHNLKFNSVGVRKTWRTAKPYSLEYIIATDDGELIEEREVILA